MFDVLVLSTRPISKSRRDQLKEKLPCAVFVENITTSTRLIDLVFTTQVWIVWNDTELADDFEFNYTVPEWDRSYNHLFLNGDEFYHGVALVHKFSLENTSDVIEHCYPNTKYLDVVASNPRPYQCYSLSSYSDYLSAYSNSETAMFWGLYNDAEIIEPRLLGLVFSSQQDYNTTVHHVFKHRVRDRLLDHGGLVLFSTVDLVSEQEFNSREIKKIKPRTEVATTPKQFDIVFISYQEPNAEENYQRLLTRFAAHYKIHRVHGVVGIHAAHKYAANLVSTPMFWVVDGDAEIVDEFNFDYQTSFYDYDVVHIWSSINPVNGLVYGYGGVKLLPTQLVIDSDITSLDMTTSISSKIRVMDEISNITAFNTDPFNAWKSAFRECAKLVLQNNKQAESRVNTWLNSSKMGKFAEYAKAGAIHGVLYATEHKQSAHELSMINCFMWLRSQFELRFPGVLQDNPLHPL